MSDITVEVVNTTIAVSVLAHTVAVEVASPTLAVGVTTPTIAVEMTTPTIVVSIPQGEQGPQGPAGAAGGPDISVVASSALGGNRVVALNGSYEAEYADCSNPNHRNITVGVTTGAAALGDLVTVRLAGEMTEAGWSWTPRALLFLGTNGLLTETPPASPSFQKIIAVAITPTTILISQAQPIQLS